MTHLSRCARLLVLTALMAAAVLLPVSAAGATGVAGAPQEVTGTLEAAKTDNYKAVYDADPNVVNLQSWLSFHGVTVAGVTYTLASSVVCPADGSGPLGATGIALTGSNGASALLTATTTSSSTSFTVLRCEQGSRNFGPLIRLKDLATRAALPSNPIPYTLTVKTTTGTVLGTVAADYRTDARLVDNPRPAGWYSDWSTCNTQCRISYQSFCETNRYCMEYNGPNGRWFINGSSIPFNWGDFPDGPSDTPPTLNAVFVENGAAGHRVRVAIAASDDHAVTEARYANEDGNFSAWSPVAAGTPSINLWTLTTSAIAIKSVSVQVRDALHQESAIVSSGGFRLTPSHDLSRGPNWYNDLLVRRTSDGAMILYKGTSTGSLSGSPATSVVATGWSIYDKVVVTRDLDGDGLTEVLARVKSGQTGAGQLRRFEYNESTGVLNQVGTVALSGGWGAFTQILAPGDFDTDGRSDLLVVKADGTMALLRGNGTGGVVAPRPIVSSANFNSYTILTPGDFSGDGRPDLVLRTSAGGLITLRGNGAGSFGSTTSWGSGWGALAIVGTGDMNQDGNADITARKPDGTLWVYKGNGTGTTSGSYQIGTSTTWGIYDRLA